MLDDAILASFSNTKHQLDNITKVEVLFEYEAHKNTKNRAQILHE